jgi:plastocyanin
MRWALILALATLAFFASYRYAIARSTVATTTPVGSATASVPGAAGGCCGGKSIATAASSGASTASSGGGGCCGGGKTAPTSAAQPKAATVAGAVQTINVDVSKGYYDPSTIQLKAGVPAEITFSQASGCTGQVQSADLNFSEDLTTGPKTVKLAGLQPGTYGFTCGMGMVSGTIVVK